MDMWLKLGDAILTCVLQILSLYSDTVTSQLCVIKQRQPFNPSSFAFYCLVSCLPLGFVTYFNRSKIIQGDDFY